MKDKFFRVFLVLVLATAFSFLTSAAKVLPAGPGDAPPPPPPSPASVKADIDIDSIKIDYEEIKKAYEYDHETPLNVEIKETRDFPGYTEYTFFYDSLNGGRVPAILMMPKPHVKPLKPERSTVEGAYPAMFLMHFHVSDKSMAQLFATWPGYGIAVMAIDGVFVGDREDTDGDILDPDPYKSGKYMKMQVLDILRGFDALASWEGLDPGRLGFMGVSMGALTGTVATALDPRIKTIILADGAADFSLMFNNSDYGSLQKMKENMTENSVTPEELVECFKYVEPAVFAPHLDDRMVYLLNGKLDTTMSMPAMEKLHNLITTEKKMIKWYDSDHILPFDRVVYDSLKWFKGTL
ncbi:MAG: hypothetical protein ABIH66_09485 [bacterium]